MEDLIKREDAIEAIEATDWYHQNRNKDMASGANSDEHQAWYKADDVYKALKEVPSAEITHDDVMQYCNSRLLVLATVEFIKHQYRIGFEDGKASADRPQGEWIDCEEPPSTDRNVFVAYGTDNMKSVCIGHYEHDMKLWYEDKNFFAKPIYDAMYWCEIPQFPTRMKGAGDE